MRIHTTGRKLFAAFLLITMIMIAVVAMPPASAAAANTKTYTIPELGMTVEIPDDMLVFTQELDPRDPNLAYAGITNPSEVVKNYRDNNIYLNAISRGGKTSITFGKKSTSKTQEIFSLGLLSDEELKKFFEEQNQITEDPNIKRYSLTPYEHKQQPFFKIHLVVHPMEEPEDKILSEISYGTIINGYTVSIDTYNEGDISQETEDLLKQIADSVVFTEILEKPAPVEAPTGAASLLMMLVPLLVIIAAVAIPMIVGKVHRRKTKKEHDTMANLLSDYRRRQKQNEQEALEKGVVMQEPETLFANVTEYLDKSIEKYCAFRVFIINMFSFIITELIGFVSLVVSLVTSGNGWLRVLLFVLGVLCIIWPVFTFRRTKKSQLKISKSYRSKTALYYFREEDFHISELQSASTYPYFQILTAYETKRYFYLFFNENQVYYVDKKGFKFGSADGFRTFLQKNLGKKFKMRTFFP